MKSRLVIYKDMTAIDLESVLGAYRVYTPDLSAMVFDDPIALAVYKAAQSWAANANRTNWNALAK